MSQNGTTLAGQSQPSLPAEREQNERLAVSVWTIVVAAGSGSRFGGRKQFESLGNRRVLDWSVATATSVCDGVVVVVPSDTAIEMTGVEGSTALESERHGVEGISAGTSSGWVAGGVARSELPGGGVEGTSAGASLRLVDGGAARSESPARAGAGTLAVGALRLVAGGSSRSESVRNGLAAVPADAAVVLVHDGARPFATVKLFERVVAAVRAGADGVIPGVAVTDTIKRVAADGTVLATVDRSDLRAVQTPQGFSASILRAAYAGDPDATDDAAVVEAAGGRVVVIEGEAENRKITTPADLAWARERVAMAAT
jgi:2-C-methyl-D-erythritol 4-phosphate cytidylyltransferase